MLRLTRRRFWNQLLAWIRWFHIYLSMIGFGVIFFFAVTGITLNHPTMFGIRAEHSDEYSGQMPTEWLRTAPAASSAETTVADQLAVVEKLRNDHHIHGALAEFQTDENECIVSFKGPGYSADAFIQRDTGHYDLSIAEMGFVALVNDLHKGRDTGANWSALIDVSAVLMALSAVTGLMLLLFLRRHRTPGLITLTLGCILTLAAWFYLVP